MIESIRQNEQGMPASAQLPDFLSSVAKGLRELRGRIGRIDRPLSHKESVHTEAVPAPAAVELLSQENNPGVVRLPSSGDTIVVFQGQAYLDNLPYLIRVATIFLHRNVGWDEEFCRELMIKGMGVEDLLPQGAQLDDKNKAKIMAKREQEIPSVFLYRAEDFPPIYKDERDDKPAGDYADYFGISVQRKMILKTELAGDVSVLDHVLRAFEPDARGHERGRSSVAWALIRHGRTRFYIHKTGNPIAAHTNKRSPYLVQEGAHPLASIHISDPLMREVRLKSSERILLPGRIINEKGVIKGDYPKPNTGFNLKELRGGALETYHKMKEVLEMRIDYAGYDGSEGFDSVAPLYMVR